MTETPPLNPATLLILSAPSGAGKTTLAHRLLKEMPSAKFSVSYTTRAPRGAEQNGIDYWFIDTKAFQQKIDQGHFVEWAQVHDAFYGSPQAVIDEANASRGLAVFDIDVQGGAAIKRKFPDAILVFILPPSMEELEQRLRRRQTDSEETIRRRLLGARSEMERGASTYDYLIINDDFERAFSELKSVVIAERCRRGRVDISHLKLERPVGG